MKWLLLLFLFPVPVSAGFCAVIYVPDDHGTIQGAINAALDGDTILVRPGTYVENIDFLGKGVTVESEQGADVTAIDGGQLNSTVTFTNGEESDSVLRGFTVTNGSAMHPVHGGGINCYYASPLITENTITGNSTDVEGGGIYTYGGEPTISDNIIIDNFSDDDGGGIACWQCSFPTITGNVISGNTADWGGGIFLRKASYPDISDNIITGNSAERYYGGGIYVWDVSSPSIVNNLIYDNFAGKDGGGICVYTQCYPTIRSNTITGNTAGVSGGAFCSKFNCGPTLTNNILWGNTAPTGAEIHHESAATPVVTYCDVEGGWTGTGNIDADPLFFDPATGDFHLQQDPCQPGVVNLCVDAGDPGSFMIHGTTRTDGVIDGGTLDLGFHYPVLFLLTVTPDPLLAGKQGVFAVTGGFPLNPTFLAFSLVGPGSTPVPLLNITLGLAAPRQAGGTMQTDSQGAGSWILPVPGGAGGRSVWLQAAQYGMVSNVVATSVQ